MLRVFRSDSTRAALIDANTAAADTPSVGPCLGYRFIKVFMRTPLGPATLVIQQYLRASSTAVATATFTTAVAGDVVTGVVDVVGEFFGVTLTEGATPDRPEVLVTLVNRSDEV